MELRLCDNITKNEYLSSYNCKMLRDTFIDYMIHGQGKTLDIARTYVDYSYKTYNSIKFVSAVLVSIDKNPYFIEEAFYSEDELKIYAVGSYAGIKYNFELI
jgi:hypothetical protein